MDSDGPDNTEQSTLPDDTLYALHRRGTGAGEIKEFIGGVSKSLELGFKEPLTDETRNLQRALVLVSFEHFYESRPQRDMGVYAPQQ